MKKKNIAVGTSVNLGQEPVQPATTEVVRPGVAASLAQLSTDGASLDDASADALLSTSDSDARNGRRNLKDLLRTGKFGVGPLTELVVCAIALTTRGALVGHLLGREVKKVGGAIEAGAFQYIAKVFFSPRAIEGATGSHNLTVYRLSNPDCYGAMLREDPSGGVPSISVFGHNKKGFEAVTETQALEALSAGTELEHNVLKARAAARKAQQDKENLSLAEAMLPQLVITRLVALAAGSTQTRAILSKVSGIDLPAQPTIQDISAVIKTVRESPNAAAIADAINALVRAVSGPMRLSALEKEVLRQVAAVVDPRKPAE